MSGNLKCRWKAVDTVHAPDYFIYDPLAGERQRTENDAVFIQGGVWIRQGDYRVGGLLLPLCILLLQECDTVVRQLFEATDGPVIALSSSFMLAYSDDNYGVFLYQAFYYLYCIVYGFFCVFISC